MIKPRCGFYITENFPKAPPITEKHKDSVVVYDINEFLNLSDKELYEYVSQLIEHFGLDWEVEELAMALTMCIAVKVFPDKTGIPKEKVAQKLASALNEEYLSSEHFKRKKSDA